MMRFRIVRRGDFYFPQRKRWIFWWSIITSIMDYHGDRRDAGIDGSKVVSFRFKLQAELAIGRYKYNRKRKYREVIPY